MCPFHQQSEQHNSFIYNSSTGHFRKEQMFLPGTGERAMLQRV